MDKDFEFVVRRDPDGFAVVRQGLGHGGLIVAVYVDRVTASAVAGILDELKAKQVR